MRVAMTWAVLLCLLWASLAWAEPGTRRLRMLNTEFPPYTSSGLPDGGGLTAASVQVLARAGYTVEVVFMPWARALAELKAGHYDGVISLWRNAEREGFLDYSAPIYVSQIGFYARYDNVMEVEPLARLAGLRIGYVRGYALPEAMVKAGLSVEPAVDDMTNLRKLAARRLDLVLIDRELAGYLLRNAPTPLPLVWMSPAVERMPVHVAFSRAHPDHQARREAFDQSLAKMQAHGEVDGVLRSYGLHPQVAR